MSFAGKTILFALYVAGMGVAQWASGAEAPTVAQKRSTTTSVEKPSVSRPVVDSEKDHRDPTIPTGDIRRVVEMSNAMQRGLTLPTVEFKGRVLGGNKGNAAMLAIDGKLYILRKGSQISVCGPRNVEGMATSKVDKTWTSGVSQSTTTTSPWLGPNRGTQTVRVTDISADEVWLEFNPQGIKETLTVPLSATR